jgi:hypothetical protein
MVIAARTTPADAQPAHTAAAQCAVTASTTTPLAYVITGDAASDAISLAGLQGLTYVVGSRTAFEPGEPMGVDIASDELAFFPLLYWRVTAGAPMPDSATIARIDDYMRNGGTILFDTADELDRSLSPSGTTPANDRLRAILATLDVPPLQPVPADHVLTKTFYLLSDFPGRFAGGPLWVEALPDTPEEVADRPAQGGDGVSPILITSNDFASAWAIDANGAFLYPVVGGTSRQREYAFRSGINIVMYTLTGNYKTDQVHVPALLERLGQ